MLGLWLAVWSATALAAPLTAEEAVALALANHLDIKKAVNSQQQADEALRSAKGAKGLSIDASNTAYLKTAGQSDADNSTDLTLSIPLYSGGKHEANIDIAKTDVDSAALALAKTRQDVRLAALSAYYDAQQALKTVQVDQESVDNYSRHLDNVRAQYAAGNLPKSDVLRSEVELADAQQALLKAENAYAVAMNKLRDVIRWQRAEAFELAPDFAYVPWAESQAACVAYAKENRPDLKQAALAIKSAEASVALAKADKRPTVSLSAGLGWQNRLLPKQVDDELQVGVMTNWNLYDSQGSAGKINQAQLAVEAAKLEREQQIDSVVLSVKEYYLGLHEAQKRLETSKAAIRLAEEDYFIAATKYRVGAGVLLDVLDAQLALSTARNNYISAQHDYATYKAELENAMGRE